MSENIIVMTPHPDDETLGCGGTLLKFRQQGKNIYWIIVTTMSDQFPIDLKQKRSCEIEKVANQYKFKKVFKLNYPVTELDRISMGSIVNDISSIFKKLSPNIIFVPYPSDIHSDHKVVFDATMSCTKWFRYPSVEKVYAYETLSETDFTINPDANFFRPNVYIDITNYLDEKINIMKTYESEMGDHPFPRSEQTMRSLAYVRGAASGFQAAEAFMLLKERIK